MVDDKDGSASKAYGLSGFPYFVLLDGDGRVKLRHSGEIETAVLEQAISEALSK
jgi:predicted DsbA family dithiol-disulfide isomerase